MDILQKISQSFRDKAQYYQFDLCGIAPAGFMEEDARRLESWLSKQMNGDMSYMANHFDMRVDPRLLVPDAKSVIVLVCNYHQSDFPSSAPFVSQYAYGKDYHKVIRKKMKSMIRDLKSEFGDFQARGFVDSAPVLERSWAVRSGLGFVGKNGNLIIPRMGSYYFISTIICDLAMAYDEPFAMDHCGSCTRCIDACPTSAILSDKIIDGSKCISYYTIESKSDNWQSENPNLQNWLFGCDLCQSVCPWNRFSIQTLLPEFNEKSVWHSWQISDWKAMNENQFDTIFESSPLKRKGYYGIQSTLQYLGKNHKSEPSNTNGNKS